MTSAFEGVPYLIYEALAMGVPVVVPALPGNVEVMRDTGGVLVDERDDPDAYADAICRLAESDDLRARMGSSGRSRMLEQFSLRAMAARHEEIYSDLLVHRQVTALPDHPPLPAPLRLCNRPVTGTPLVSVVTPCFNHGRYLSSYLEAIRGQDYPEIEVIIVDDASTDPETVAVLRQIEQDGDARVIWQEANRGPSAARNRAIDAANGRYVLPVDSDNILLEGSVRSLVEQLQTAGEQIGFIYPGFEYFGTRDYRYQPPAYNLFRLLQGNYVDTCSLLDREIFDAGFRYGEDIELGHEDWDLALALGAREVYGQPSRMPVMRYRKQGFTRSDAVEYLRLPFYEEIQERRPELFGFARDIGSWGRYSGPAIKIKARWNPALSLIATGPVDFASEEGIGLVEALQRQSCADFELLVECELAPRLDSPVVRRIPPGLATSVVGRLEEALVLARGRYVMAARNPLEVLSDPTTVEKLTRAFGIDQRLDAVALADLGPSPSNFPFRLVDEVPQNAIAHAVAWRRRGREFGGLTICGPVETHSVATELHRAGATMYWRHFPSHGSQLLEAAADVEPGGVLDVVDARPRAGDRPTRLEADQRLDVAPAIPAMPHDQVIRWTWSPAWMPPETVPLVRHVHVDGSHRIITTDRTPPADYKIEFDLGSIQRFAPPGTIRLVRRGGAFLTAPRGSERRDDDQELGHLEEAPLPLFVAIERATLADGSETLVLASDRDPTRALARELTFLGFIEGYPNEPVARPAYTKVSTDVAAGQAVLVRVLDYQSRRHRYRTAASYEQPVGAGEVATPLGRLSTVQTRGAIAVRIDGRGRIATDRYSPTRSSPDVRELAKWSLAPVRWRGFGHRYGRARAVVRRGGDSARLAAGAVTHLGPGRAARPSEWLQVGFLYEDSAPGRTELFAATHPVLDDQFVTDRPSQASDMGYRDVQSIGYADEVAPSTRALANDRVAIPWASRFGLLTRG
jgi:glycosyltransferase involved in cell wall biosynthesis